VSPAAEAGPWRSRAFGIEIEGDFPAPGLPALDDEARGPSTRVEVVGAEQVDANWDAERASRLLEERFDGDAEAARTIDHVPGHGYRLYARHFGLAWVSEPGDRVLCAPPEDEPWSWQRFLVGRILPWAAVLRGREVFHASAVSIDGRAVAIIGQTGAGKTSLATHLVLGGARFFTDDVLALHAERGRIVAHPGTGILCLRDAELAAMPEGTAQRLGTVLGVSGKTYVEVERENAPQPLGALYFIKRSDVTRIDRLDSPGPTLLLSSTFNSSIRTPERLRRQFELAADLAAQTPIFELHIGPDSGGAAVLAQRLRDHVAEL
jgi:hypothetical protein